MLRSKDQQIKELEALAKGYSQTKLDLSPYREVLTDELLLPILRNANTYLEKLTIDYCTKLTENTPNLIAEHCPNITHLSTKYMPWYEWTTWGWFSDAKFPELLMLNIEGSCNLRKLYTIAPKLQNLDDIANVFHQLKHLRWPGKKIHISFEINKEHYGVEATAAHVEACVVRDLKNNSITKLSLNPWEDPKSFISTIIPHLATNHSLTSLTINNQYLKVRDIIPLLDSLEQHRSLVTLNLSHNQLGMADLIAQMGFKRGFSKLLTLPLKNLGLSQNKFDSYSGEIIANSLMSNTTLQTLDLSDNDFSLSSLTTALIKNQSLTELKLDGSPEVPNPSEMIWDETSEFSFTPVERRKVPYYFHTYHNRFEDISLIPFFNTLTNQNRLQSVTVAGYFTDQSTQAITSMLAENKTLTHLCINQHSYQCKFIKGNFGSFARSSYVFMTDKGADKLAEGIRANRTLKSLQLKNVLFNAPGFKVLADALEQNTNITTFDINRASNPNLQSRLAQFPQLTKDEPTLIHAQTLRIQQYTARNRAALEEKQPSIVPLSIFSNEQKVVPLVEPVLLPDLSIIPEGASADLTLKLLVAHVTRINKLLDIDPEAESEKSIIAKNPLLQEYYEKICELYYYLQASQTISTQLVAKQDDIQDMITSLTAEIAKTVLHFIPIASGFTGAVKALETAEHCRHDVEKHCQAINLVRFTHGLGILAEKRLVYCFARKLTLMNQDQIDNADAALAAHSHGFMLRLIANTKQKVRELREGHRYKAHQQLALIDTFKILEAIANETIKRPAKGTEDERFEQMLATMLRFMQQEKEKALKHDTPAPCLRRA